MKLHLLALALVSCIDAVTLHDDFNDGPNKSKGFLRDNYIKDDPPQEAKGTGHPEFEGQVYGHSRLVNETEKEEANKQEFQYGYHKYVSGLKYS